MLVADGMAKSKVGDGNSSMKGREWVYEALEHIRGVKIRRPNNDLTTERPDAAGPPDPVAQAKVARNCWLYDCLESRPLLGRRNQ